MSLITVCFFSDTFVHPEDFVVASDADAFVMSGSIFANLPVSSSVNNNNGHQVWLYQYQDSLRFETPLSMSFVAMRARTWSQVLEGAESPEDLVARHACQMNLHFQTPWSYDQLILSRAVLKSGLCSLPGQNRLWDRVRLDPDTLEDLSEEEARNSAFRKEMRALVQEEGAAGKDVPPKKARPLLGKVLKKHFNKLLFNVEEQEEVEPVVAIEEDLSSTCFYGFDWDNCNQGRQEAKNGCKWWHFSPTDTERNLMKKYREIRDQRT